MKPDLALNSCCAFRYGQLLDLMNETIVQWPLRSSGHFVQYHGGIGITSQGRSLPIDRQDFVVVRRDKLAEIIESACCYRHSLGLSVSHAMEHEMGCRSTYSSVAGQKYDIGD